MDYNKIYQGIVPKGSKDALQALKMDYTPCKGGLTAHPATKYLAVSHYLTLTSNFYTN